MIEIMQECYRFLSIAFPIQMGESTYYISFLMVLVAGVFLTTIAGFIFGLANRGDE